MPFSSLSGPIGHQQVALFGLPDTTQRVQSGLVGDFVSPYWGGVQCVYGQASGTIAQNALCSILPIVTGGKYVHQMSQVANTAIMGRPLCVAMTSMVVNQWGWFMVAGITPVNCSASVAADTTFSIAAAGQGGALAAGKQVVNARVVIAATQTVAKTGCVANNNSTRLTVPSEDGWFIGAYLSGTGIAAATTVTDIDPSGTVVTLSAVTTAAVNGTVTATYNNATIFYNVVHLHYPFAQGAIT